MLVSELQTKHIMLLSLYVYVHSFVVLLAAQNSIQ
jgi:hypothetical protein